MPHLRTLCCRLLVIERTGAALATVSELAYLLVVIVGQSLHVETAGRS